MKMFEFPLMFHQSLFLRVQLTIVQYISIGSNKGLSPVRRQAIIWTNGGLVYWGIYMSLDLNELIRFNVVLDSKRPYLWQASTPCWYIIGGKVTLSQFTMCLTLN